MSLEAFTPFIPLNVDDSSLPVAIFKYAVKNHSTKPVDFSLAFSLLNAVGYDGKAYLDGISVNHPGFGGNITKLRQEQELAGLDLTSKVFAQITLVAGSMALLTTAQNVHCTHQLGGRRMVGFYQKWVDEFSAEGKMHDSQPPQPSADGKSDYATLAPYAQAIPG